MESWHLVQRLAAHAASLPTASEIVDQLRAIEEQRTLLVRARPACACSPVPKRRPPRCAGRRAECGRHARALPRDSSLRGRKAGRSLRRRSASRSSESTTCSTRPTSSIGTDEELLDVARPNVARRLGRQGAGGPDRARGGDARGGTGSRARSSPGAASSGDAQDGAMTSRSTSTDVKEQLECGDRRRPDRGELRWPLSSELRSIARKGDRRRARRCRGRKLGALSGFSQSTRTARRSTSTRSSGACGSRCARRRGSSAASTASSKSAPTSSGTACSSPASSPRTTS